MEVPPPQNSERDRVGFFFGGGLGGGRERAVSESGIAGRSML